MISEDIFDVIKYQEKSIKIHTNTYFWSLRGPFIIANCQKEGSKYFG